MCSSLPNRALETLLLLVGKQVGARCPVSGEREHWVAGLTAVPAAVLLSSAPASVQSVTGQVRDVEGIHHRDCVGQLLGGRGLNP